MGRKESNQTKQKLAESEQVHLNNKNIASTQQIITFWKLSLDDEIHSYQTFWCSTTGWICPQEVNWKLGNAMESPMDSNNYKEWIVIFVDFIDV